MFAKILPVVLVSASLALVPAQRALANNHAAILGGLIVGGIIVNEINKDKKRKQAAQQQQRQQQQRSNANAAAHSAQRTQNRQVQTALNYFGYNVGRVDGAIGPKTRGGISRYQADMGYNTDGRLDDYERDFLLNSQQRAEASYNVAPYNTILATEGRGGLLRTFRNEQLGITPVTPAVATPTPTPVPVAPKTTTTRAETATLPQFDFSESGQSVSTLCNQINALTVANGGVTSAARVTDAEFALNEQFCLARTHAIAEAATIEATIPNMSAAQIEAQCKGLAQAVAPHMMALGGESPDTIIGSTSAFMQDSGQPMERLISGGKVCLGVGYRTDDADMALASGVLLASGGQLGYAEIVSHQLREGFGIARSSQQQSGAWMTLGLEGMSAGNPMVLGQSPDRIAVLSAAMKTGGASTAALPVFPSSN